MNQLTNHIIKSTTQDHLDVQDIAQDLVVLKDGSACLVLEVSALNFGLLSEKEQDATIYAYAQLLNSLTFSIQIVVSSKQRIFLIIFPSWICSWEKLPTLFT